MGEKPSFIKLQYGDCQETVLNAWCPNMTLLACIRRLFDCPEEIDLVTSEGEVQNIRHSPYQYANECLAPRETYILLQVDRASSGPPKFTPMLDNVEEYYPELVAKLDNLSRPSTKKNSKWASGTKKERAARFIRKDSSLGKKKGSYD